MSRRNYTGLTIVMVILFFDGVVYRYQSANRSKAIIVGCYPPGEISSSRDSNENNKYDRISRQSNNQENILNYK